MTQKRGNWRVVMRCEVTKEVYCQDCTEEQAIVSPWDHSVGEQEVEQHDWRVVDMKEDRQPC
jgi:hypothetical protein